MSARGAIWKQWDLHVHTPASFRWSGRKLRDVEGDERARLLDGVLERMAEVEVEAFAIMDYWTFDGYWALCERLEARNDAEFKKVIFPGMELRCEAPADFRLNMHVLLSSELTSQQLLNFKSKLKLVHTDEPLSDEGLARLARAVTPDKLTPHGIDVDRLNDDDYASDAGAVVALVKRDSLYEAVASMPKGSALIMAPWEPYHGVAEMNLATQPVVISEIMSQTDVWETRRSVFIDLFHGRETSKNRRFLENFLGSIGGVPRPAVSGSDAHGIGQYGGASVGGDGEQRRTWVKADPTFAGLRQTLNEPAARVYIGTEPPEHTVVRENPTRYIRSVKIWKAEDADLDEEWFDAEIPLNPYLVAIIGNKGSGKSALLDIIGLLGQSRASSHFSFLNRERFRNPRSNKASNFVGRLEWRDGVSSEMRLSDSVQSEAVERVKYVPQSYLESVCNEVDLRAGGRFRTELESVIFSHVPQEKRLGCSSLAELLQHKVRETDDRIRLLREDLSGVNLRIEALEDLARPEKRLEIEGVVAEIKRDLDAIDAQKPAEVEKPDPADEDDDTRAVREAVELAEARLATLKDELKASQLQLNDVTANLDKARQARDILGTLEMQFNGYKDRLEPILSDLGLAVDTVVALTIDRGGLEAAEKQLKDQKSGLEQALDDSIGGSCASNAVGAAAELRALREQLEGPQKAYNEYLAALKLWQERRGKVVGDAAAEGSLAHAEARLAALDAVPSELETAVASRKDKVQKIFAELVALRTTYEELYAPVQSFAEDHELLAERFRPEFSVRLEAPDFPEGLLSRLSRSRSGSFYGEAAEGVAARLVEECDFESADSVVAFVEGTLDRLKRDYRVEGVEKPPRRVADQLRQGGTPHELYDYVAGLSFLKPEYRLQLHGKGLGELSPGERGTLLLMFYLLVDRSKTPLLIDQPEENLDNQTVFSLVGQCIREAKRRRQVIIVTHNPNLARDVPA